MTEVTLFKAVMDNMLAAIEGRAAPGTSFSSVSEAEYKRLELEQAFRWALANGLIKMVPRVRWMADDLTVIPPDVSGHDLEPNYSICRHCHVEFLDRGY